MGWARRKSYSLEGKVADPADHEQPHENDEQEADVGDGGREEVRQHAGEEHEGRQRAAARRDGQADEETLAHEGGAHVEARQTQRPAGGVDEGHGHAPAPEGLELPLPHEHGRRHAEGHQIRQGIVLDAELAGRAGQAGHLAVHAVQQSGEEYSVHRGLETPLHGPDHAQETHEHAEGRDEVGEHIDPPVRGFLALLRRAVLHGCFHSGADPLRLTGSGVGPRRSVRRKRVRLQIRSEHILPAGKGQLASRSGSCRSARRAPGCPRVRPGRRCGGR